jgi:hypothetical protein
LAAEESGTVELRPTMGVDVQPGDRKGWIRVATVVMAYRLVDVIGLLNDVEMSCKMERKKFAMEKLPDVCVLEINSRIY